MSNIETSPEAGPYYIRVRGKVLGPFTLDKLKSLRARGQFSRVHEVSTDRQTWQPASTLDGLLGAGRVSGVAPDTAPQQAATASAQAVATIRPAETPAASWYFNAAGEQRGPVSIMELRSMVSAGKLRPDDYVWKDGMPDWLPISHIAELQCAPSPYPGASAFGAGGNAQPLGDGIHHTSGLAIASLIMGILGLITPFLGLVFNLLAVVFGGAALKTIAKSRVVVGGRGMAISGLIMGIIGLALWAIVLLYWFGLLAVIGITAVGAS